MTAGAGEPGQPGRVLGWVKYWFYRCSRCHQREFGRVWPAPELCSGCGTVVKPLAGNANERLVIEHERGT